MKQFKCEAARWSVQTSSEAPSHCYLLTPVKSPATVDILRLTCNETYINDGNSCILPDFQPNSHLKHQQILSFSNTCSLNTKWHQVANFQTTDVILAHVVMNKVQ